MTSLTLLAYLDKILRLLRPGSAHVMFAGIPVLLTGDSFQLPVVNGKIIVSQPDNIPMHLRNVFKHCTVLRLSKSVRQSSDSSFASTLLRIRVAQESENDANLLNSRYFTDINQFTTESSEWTKAPILTAKNVTVDALNSSAVARNGAILGTYHLHSMPVLSNAKTEHARKMQCEHFFSNQNTTNLCKKRQSGSTFKHKPKMVLYPGIPLMLRTNVCPALGLSNGSLGTLVNIVHGLQSKERKVFHSRREDLPSLIDRAVKGCPNDPAEVPSLLVAFPKLYKGRIAALKGQENGPHSLLDPSKTVLLRPILLNGVRVPPVSISHSFPMHKVQSLTLPRTIVVPRDVFSMGALYVAFSRAPTLQRLALIYRVTQNQLNKFQKQVAQIQARLDFISEHSICVTPFQTYVQRRLTAHHNLIYGNIANPPTPYIYPDY